jgi:predicted ATPase
LLNDASPRLITLTGTGGVGKTRLALEVAAAVSTAFPDGVCFVPLASVSGPALVVPAVADALGVRKSAGDSLQDELARFLRTKHFLLVLDNFEHVLPAALVVTELLATCAGLKVLATSRVPLQLRGERQVPILPLGVPETEGSRSREDIAESEAVRLFVARGQEVKPEFALNDDNVEAIADICRRLDGLPLALELAAVRVKVLTPYALLRRLEHRLPMLIGGARDLPARHQTLRATIAWSYDLLSPEEQTLFRRLAVFIGGWTLEGAKAVVAPEGAFDLFDGLGSLVDKSLVQCTDGLDGEPRYLMLETVREFAEEKLVDSGEEDDIGRGHANYCLVLAQAGSQGLADSAVGDWLARMEAEQANIRAALAWLLDHALPEDGLRLANALGGFWGSRSAQDEGRAWIEAFLALPSNTQRMANERVDALRWLGVTSGYEGDLASAEADLNESLAIARQLGDKRGMYMGLGAIAIARTHHGDVAGGW